MGNPKRRETNTSSDNGSDTFPTNDQLKQSQNQIIYTEGETIFPEDWDIYFGDNEADEEEFYYGEGCHFPGD